MIAELRREDHNGGAQHREADAEHDAKRREIADRIHAAREFSTTQNNAEYDDAKNELELIEARIRTLEQQLQHAEVIDEERAHRASNVVIGCTVIVEADGKHREYTIVGSAEADPATGRISNESPVGRALLGKRVGEEVQVLAPRGMTFSGLTEREIEVLRLVAEGYDTAEIAKTICFSERTIKSILHDVTTRLQLRNRAHAVAYAVREGLI